jgi:predicted transglutaminase-like protease
MKVEVYGNKLLKEKVEKEIMNILRNYPIAEARIYLKDVPRVCMNCMYFPCNESCKIKR